MHLHKIISKHNGVRAGTRGEWHLTTFTSNISTKTKISHNSTSNDGLYVDLTDNTQTDAAMEAKQVNDYEKGRS